MRRGQLKRRTALARKRRTAPHYERKLEERLRQEWARGARRRPCAMCGARSHIHGHHICERAWIVAQIKALAYGPVKALMVLYDPRNRLSVCETCHAQHHGWAWRIPRQVVLAGRPQVWDFAVEHGLEWRFERAYPPDAPMVADG